MEVLEQLGLALGFATLAGINLYLTVFVTGVAVRFGWVDLAQQYDALSILGNEWIVGIAGVFMVIEFFADKVPWVDSSWDALHTLIRPVGGAMLALAALGELDPAFTVVAGLFAGGTSLVTHTAKAGTRLLINLSPEPVSNAVASVSEDGLVLGGLGAMALMPVASFFLFLAFVLFALWLLRRSSGALKVGWGKLRGLFSKKKHSV